MKLRSRSYQSSIFLIVLTSSIMLASCRGRGPLGSGSDNPSGNDGSDRAEDLMEAPDPREPTPLPASGPGVTQKFTTWKSLGSFNENQGNVVYLDRHAPTCTEEEGALTGFVLEAGPSAVSLDDVEQIRFSYQCRSGEFGAREAKTTPYAGDGNGPVSRSIVTLDRHAIDCQPNQVLTSFSMRRGPEGVEEESELHQYRFNYTCATYTEELSCYQVCTPYSGDAGQLNLAVLREHTVKCRADEYLQKIRVRRGPTGPPNTPLSLLQLSYRCCGVGAVAPEFSNCGNH